MKPIKLTIYGGKKVGDTILVPLKTDRTRSKRVKISKFCLWRRGDGLVYYPGYKDGDANHFISLDDLIKLNPDIEIKETFVQPKLYKATGKTLWGDEDFYQWIAEYEDDEVKMSRLFKYIPTSDGKLTEWYENNSYEKLPKSTRQETVPLI